MCGDAQVWRRQCGDKWRPGPSSSCTSSKHSGLAYRWNCKAYGSVSLLALMQLAGLADRTLAVKPGRVHSLGPFDITTYPASLAHDPSRASTHFLRGAHIFCAARKFCAHWPPSAVPVAPKSVQKKRTVSGHSPRKLHSPIPPDFRLARYMQYGRDEDQVKTN